MIDNTSIQGKIEDIRKGLTKDNSAGARQIEAWQNKLQELDGYAEYAQLPITLHMLAKAQKIVRDARFVLATDKNLSDRERDALFAKVDAHLWYLNMFDTNRIEREIQGIGASVEAVLETYEPPTPDVPYMPANLNKEPAETPEPDIPVEVDYPTREGMPSSILLGPE